MKKLLLLAIVLSFATVIAQPAGMIDETFRLESLEVFDTYFTPNGVNADFRINDTGNGYTFEASGVQNSMFGTVTFNGTNLTLSDIAITLVDCMAENCYYENEYFYTLLTTQTLTSKTFTYFYGLNSDGSKRLRLRDSTGKDGVYTTRPAQQPDPLLFQTWYLHSVEVDLGDIQIYTGPDVPRITINNDLSYTGLDGCNLISGDFIHVNGNDNYPFRMQSRNYNRDDSGCNGDNNGYIMYDLTSSFPLGCTIYEYPEGLASFSWETAPGFIFSFSNQLTLSVQENQLAQITIYPNPVSNTLFINSEVVSFEAITITDVNGRIIQKNINQNTREIDVSILQSGFYFLNLVTAEGRLVKKFSKQ